MVRFFTRERFGRPQVLAGCLLLVFLAQCLWLVGRARGPARSTSRRSTGWNVGRAVAGSEDPDQDDNVPVWSKEAGPDPAPALEE